MLATVIQVEGSAPRQPGAKMLMLADGTTVGTVGGGALELAVVQACTEALAGSEPRLLSYDLRPDLKMVCGGRARVFIEPLCAPRPLFLFGAGHIGLALHPLAQALGFAVTVVDDRPELASAARFPGAAALVHSYEPEQLAALPVDRRAYCVVATRGHKLDTEVVQLLMQREPRYVGMIGSLTKRRAVERELVARGVPEQRLATLTTPMGLDIGAESPQEIAVSIAAQLVQVRHSADHDTNEPQIADLAKPTETNQ